MTTTCDFVFTWVDGSDPLHAQLRTKFMSHGVPPAARSPKRWRDNGELISSVKCLLKNAGWLHKIYVICSLEQQPKGLPVDTRINIIQDTVLYAGEETRLPTFNSHALEVA